MQVYSAFPCTFRALSCLAPALLALVGCTNNEPVVPGPAAAEPGSAAEAVRNAAHRLTGAANDYDPLLALIGDARVVLIGEASHGTHEFYEERARITQRLISEKGFDAVAIEGDWPDAYRVNQFVRGVAGDPNATQALSEFAQFPVWMWRNREVLNFVEWLRRHNQALAPEARVGFYGLDVYSLYPSMDAVLGYLERVDPAAAQTARTRYACFGRFNRDPQAYGQAVDARSSASCQNQAAEQLQDLQARRSRLAPANDRAAQDAFYSAVQNARLVVGAEEYFRSLYLRTVSTWNLRDRYMVQTLDSLVSHLEAARPGAKVVVWAHNSHIGDARATHMGEQGEWNLGQLARERWGTDAVLVGQTTYTGTVVAASDWGAAPERKRVNPALPESHEAVFHATGIPRFLLTLRSGPAVEPMRQARLERAIGVIYLPQTERMSHYFHARLSDQFDAVIHFDETRGLEPLSWSPGTLAAITGAH